MILMVLYDSPSESQAELEQKRTMVLMNLHTLNWAVKWPSMLLPEDCNALPTQNIQKDCIIAYNMFIRRNSEEYFVLTIDRWVQYDVTKSTSARINVVRLQFIASDFMEHRNDIGMSNAN